MMMYVPVGFCLLLLDQVSEVDVVLMFQGAMAIFEMMDFYESANRLVVSHNGKLGCRAWIACSKMMKKVVVFFKRWLSLSITYVYNMEGRACGIY